MGLSIIRNIVELHEGHIYIKNQIEGGIKVIMMLSLGGFEDVKT